MKRVSEDNEKLRMELERRKQELELRSQELEKKEAQNENEKKRIEEERKKVFLNLILAVACFNYLSIINVLCGLLI